MPTLAKKALLVALLAVVLAAGLAAQTKPSPAPLLGTWLLEVNAGGESYFLPLELKLVEEKLAGGVSEQSGMFTNVPLTNFEWDGVTLKFAAKIPTPPDGAERICKFEFKLDQAKLVGTLTIEEMGMTVPVTGTKK
ncbi:MAG: hypothetical protein NTZ26_00505 [Candidatus Aminicenantes bacterium]|nr:hypothetical protein [Candidatus Aminicenantes bacterium]